MPWFVNWNDYRPDFENQASRILGHPVHVRGTARASILPSPSVTFTDVVVGDPDKPLMTVSRFAVTVELVPLIGGQIRVVAMKLDEPAVHIAVDAVGVTDWLERAPAATALAPDSVALTDVAIENGSLDYHDASNGTAFAVTNINAAIESPSLFGPWKVKGTWGADDRSQFAIATGRRLDDGSIRVKFDATPAVLPVRIGLDGSLSVAADSGVKYAGTYDIGQVASVAPETAADTAPATTVPVADGWESQGSFTLTRERAVIDKAVLSHNAEDGGTSVAGSLTLDFGRDAAFDATIEAKQLDLDRALGGGVSQPASLTGLATTLAGWATTAAPLPIPGKISVDLPAVVIGGAVAQNVALVAATTHDGWQISTFNAALPGQATLSMSGALATGRQLGFDGKIDFAVGQPAVLAGWWRGTAPPVSAAPLPAFSVSGDAMLGVDHFAIAGASARVGDAAMTGSFSWSRDRQYRREIDADINADKVDLDSLGALAALAGGDNFADVRSLADRFQVRFAASALALKGVTASNVAVDAGYTDDTLKVVQIAIGDIGGASLHVTGGRIDNLSTATASGHLEAHLDADRFDGLARAAAAIAPASGVAEWIAAHGAVLAPASVDIHVAAPAKDGGGAYGIDLSGTSGPTTFDALLQSDARPADFWAGVDRLSLRLDSRDSAALARQFGVDAAASGRDTGAHVAIKMSGAPAKGLATTIEGSFAGLTANGSGTTILDADERPRFDGTANVSSDDIAPFLEMAGIALPGTGDDARVAVAGTVAASQAGMTLAWKDGRFLGRTIGGKATVAALDGAWNVAGDLDIDLLDLRWLTALGLGAPLAPGAGPSAPWTKTPFMAPDLGKGSVRVALAAGKLAVTDAIAIENARTTVAANAERVDLTVIDGTLAGGKASGTLSLRNPDGNAGIAAQFTVRGAAIAPFVWQTGGAPLATGTFDLTANVEASGRSANAVVSSLTGGGTIGLHDVTLQSVNGDAVAPIVRVADLGEQYTEDLLKAAVESQIDAGSVGFADAGSAFSVAAGTVRFNDVAIDTAKVSLAGDTAIDLNQLALTSDWTSTFKSAADGADVPAVHIAFHGPIAAPVRSIDVVSLSSYLSARQAGRMIQILAVEDADRLEQERFAREILRFRDEPMRGERQQRADAAAAQAQALAARAALQQAAAVTAAARDTAQAAATAAATAADQAHARAKAAGDALAKATADRAAAVAAEAKAASVLADARSASNIASANAADLAVAAEAADKRMADATSGLAVAQAAADKVEAAVRAADDRLDAARTRTADAKAAADAAAKEADDSGVALQTASHAASDALNRSDAARAALDAATNAVASAQAVADKARAAVDDAVQVAAMADADRARFVMIAKNASDAAAAAAAARDTVRKTFQDASAAATNAQLDADRAEGQGMPAFTLADKKAAVASARQQLEATEDRYHEADATATDLAAQAEAAQSAADKAANVATLRHADVANATALRNAALAALDAKSKARDDAAAAVAAAADAAKSAGAAFNDAEARARSAADQAAAAADAERAAESDLTDATRAAAAVTAGSAGFALQQATAAKNAAVSDSAAAHAKADAASAASTEAKARLDAAASAHDDAAAAVALAEAVRKAAAAASGDADTAANAADTASAAAAATAGQRETEASAAAAALAAAGPAPASRSGESVPLPRQKPPKSAPVTSDAPLQLVPLQ